MESKKENPLLVDPVAVQVIESMDCDFSTIARHIGGVTQAGWIARSLHADRILRAFLDRHPYATVVNLGCGLDTTFARVDNGSLLWYDLDLPEVIDLRSRYIHYGSRTRTIACSLLSDQWLSGISVVNGVFFLALGVLYYFREQQVRDTLRMLAARFPRSEALFDICSPRGLKVANKRVIQSSGMDSSAMLQWALPKPAVLEHWGPPITILDAWPMFSGFRSRARFPLSIGMWISDALRIQSLVHLWFGR